MPPHAAELHGLRERAKELRCLYRIHDIVSERRASPTQTFLAVLEAIPDGWQRPHRTGARIEYLGRSFVGPGYTSDAPTITEDIRLGGVVVGHIEVSHCGRDDDDDHENHDQESDATAVFLDEEVDLLRNIAHRLSDYLAWKHTELLGERSTTDGIHWRWRERYAAALADAIDTSRFNVHGIWLGGSTESGDAGPGSDIDLVVDFRGSDDDRAALGHWLEGWSRCLAEFAYRHTGYRFPHGILNVQWITEPPDPARRPDLRSLTLRTR